MIKVWRLIGTKEQFLFNKSKKMLDVKATLIALVRV